MINDEYAIGMINYLKEWDRNFNLFKNRYEIFKKIDCINDPVNWWTYFDILVVMLRALCLENNRYINNYTVQNLFKKIEHFELEKELESYLEKAVVEQDNESLYRIEKDGVYVDLSIRIVLKHVADKIICHNDYMEYPGENIIYLNLLSFNNGEGLKRIIDDILNILR